MAAIIKQIKTIVPIVGEYMRLVHPNTPSKIPTANTTKVMALLAFSVISSPPWVLYSTILRSLSEAYGLKEVILLNFPSC